MDMAGRCYRTLEFCLCHHQMTRLIACLSLTLSSSVQVDSDRAVGGARRGVQHLLLQVGLQREHRVPHQALLRREEAQDHRWDFVRGRWWHSLYHSSEAEFGFGWKMWVSSCVFSSFSSPNDKKSFCSIEGEWNGVMYAKWATGVSSFMSFFHFFQWEVEGNECLLFCTNMESLFSWSKNRLLLHCGRIPKSFTIHTIIPWLAVCFQENTAFIDTKRMAIIKKKVRKLEDQLDYESRRWEINWSFSGLVHYGETYTPIIH